LLFRKFGLNVEDTEKSLPKQLECIKIHSKEVCKIDVGPIA